MRLTPTWPAAVDGFQTWKDRLDQVLPSGSVQPDQHFEPAGLPVRMALWKAWDLVLPEFSVSGPAESQMFPSFLLWCSSQYLRFDHKVPPLCVPVWKYLSTLHSYIFTICQRLYVLSAPSGSLLPHTSSFPACFLLGNLGWTSLTEACNWWKGQLLTSDHSTT